MSSFVWLDYSERERRKMLDVVDLFKEHDTRDELGLAAIRDSFADQFFPGTSTIMTRARYFLLVAWTYQRLERQRVTSARMPDRARRAETDLIEAIEHSDDNDGNIGKYAKTALKRLPSSVYWHGLNVWGIRTFPGAQTQYHRGLDRYYAQLHRHGGRATERDVEHDDLVAPNWHAGLISPPETFPDECSLSLTRAEAQYLSERIRLNPLCAGSLLAELVARHHKSKDADFVWQLSCVAELPPKLRELLEHARNYSEVMHGAPLLYNLILAEQERWDEGIEDYRGRFAEWASLIAGRSSIFQAWKRARFWELAHADNTRVSSPTYDFSNTWWDFVLAVDASKLRDNPTVRALIRDREHKLKKNLARIGNPRARELWNGDSGSAQLEYRWLISQRLLEDIFKGLEAPDA
jgi:Family of unknown function (DUF6361)